MPAWPNERIPSQPIQDTSTANAFWGHHRVMKRYVRFHPRGNQKATFGLGRANRDPQKPKFPVVGNLPFIPVLRSWACVNKRQGKMLDRPPE